MTRKIVDTAILFVGIAFLCWYLPVAYNNVYACDDYWFGTNVKQNGLWSYQLIHWSNWEGSYTHTFLASLPHAFSFSRMPFIGNMFSLLLLFLSIFAFLKTYAIIGTKRCLSYSLYLLSFLYLCTKGNSEIRFWICANITYVSEMAFLLLLFTIYHNLNWETPKKKWAILLFVLFLVGGSKLSYILYAISGLMIHDVIFEKSINKKTIVVCLLLAVFVALNVSAPGNYIRLDVETMPKETEEQMTMLGSVLYRVIEMIPFLLCIVFLFPIATQWRINKSFKGKCVKIALVIFFVTFILDGIVMYICFNDPGPLRVYFITEVFVAILALFLFNHFYSTILSKYKFEKYMSLLFSIWVIISNVSLILDVPDSIVYSNLARERDEYVSSYTEDGTIEISPLPNSHLMLSYFANDIIWLENIYLPYFQKDGKVILLETP